MAAMIAVGIALGCRTNASAAFASASPIAWARTVATMVAAVTADSARPGSPVTPAYAWTACLIVQRRTAAPTDAAVTAAAVL